MRIQDLTLHRGEVHSKLVGIMRERLIAALKQLPAIADRWGAVSVEDDITPSSFSLGLAKQLRTLSKVTLDNIDSAAEIRIRHCHLSQHCCRCWSPCCWKRKCRLCSGGWKHCTARILQKLSPDWSHW